MTGCGGGGAKCRHSATSAEVGHLRRLTDVQSWSARPQIATMRADPPTLRIRANVRRTLSTIMLSYLIASNGPNGKALRPIKTASPEIVVRRSISLKPALA
jgi:hypothetical protein